jgi:hypothetical protein
MRRKAAAIAAKVNNVRPRCRLRDGFHHPAGSLSRVGGFAVRKDRRRILTGWISSWALLTVINGVLFHGGK